MAISFRPVGVDASWLDVAAVCAWSMAICTVRILSCSPCNSRCLCRQAVDSFLSPLAAACSALQTRTERCVVDHAHLVSHSVERSGGRSKPLVSQGDQVQFLLDQIQSTSTSTSSTTTASAASSAQRHSHSHARPIIDVVWITDGSVTPSDEQGVLLCPSLAFERSTQAWVCTALCDRRSEWALTSTSSTATATARCVCFLP